MASPEEIAIFNDLQAVGCCDRCSLRYLCDHFANFSNVENYIDEMLLKPPSTGDEKIKKQKLNPCVVCLGLLEDTFIDNVLSDSTILSFKPNVRTSYGVELCTPASLLIRAKSMEIYLKEKYPSFYENKGEPTQLNRAWKFSIRDKLNKLLGKRHDETSDFKIVFNISYSLNEEELKILSTMNYKKFCFKSRKKKVPKSMDLFFSRNAVKSYMDEIAGSYFKKNIAVPPKVSSSMIKLDNIQFRGHKMFIAGRYCKYDRRTAQTPWNPPLFASKPPNISGNVQDILFTEIESFLGYPKENLTFTASGREDADTRCLGSGRPFIVTVDKPDNPVVTYDMCRELEERINKSPYISVFDLQTTDKNKSCTIKEGEENKRKIYVALCLVRESKYDTKEIINKINSIKRCVIQQLTPVRVMHRRSVLDREKAIHNMEASEIPGTDKLFELKLITQSGTYVKEFIHGDLGRTKPSLGSLLDSDLDIMKLDVVHIDLDWPPQINSKIFDHSFVKEMVKSE